MSPIVSRRRRNEPAGHDEAHPGHGRKLGDERVDDCLGGAEEHPAGLRLQGRDPGQDRRLTLLGEAAHVPEPAGLCRVPQVLEVLDAERLVEDPHRPRPDARHPQQLDERRRHLGPEAVVERHVARRDQLRDLVADGRADTLDPGPVARAVGRRDVGRRVRDRVGRPVIRDGLEDQLALDLEHVADLVEDPRENAVGQLAPGPARLGVRVRGSAGSTWASVSSASAASSGGHGNSEGMPRMVAAGGRVRPMLRRQPRGRGRPVSRGRAPGRPGPPDRGSTGPSRGRRRNRSTR